MSDKMITVKMPLDAVRDVRGMLVFERIMAEGDYENVADLHNGSAVGAARDVLYTEIEKFTRIIGFIDEALGVSGDRTMTASITEKLRAAGVLKQEEEQ